jgi:hypothetical protein
MMQELKHDLFEHKNCQVSNYSRIKTLYQLPHVAFSVSNHITMNEAVSTFAMNIKNKAKNTCVHMQQRSVSLSHTKNARIHFIQTKQKQKQTDAPSKAHKM